MAFSFDRARWACLSILAATLLALGLHAVRDVTARAEAERGAREEALRQLGELAGSLYTARDARLASELQRLRAQLRSEGIWQASASWSRGGDARRAASSSRESGDRRLAAVLRRAFGSVEEAWAYDLVVAGEDGLSMLRVERDPASPERSSAELDGLAKALWYGDEVRRAVAAGGLRVERGEASWETAQDEGTGRASMRLALALHEPTELVQGVVVARVDLSQLVQGLEQLAGPDHSLRLVSSLGQTIPSRSSSAAQSADESQPRAGMESGVEAGMPPGSERAIAWAAKVLEAPDSRAVFQAEDRLVFGLPLEHADGRASKLVLLASAPAAPAGLAAWGATAWPAALLALVLASAVGGWALVAGNRRTQRVETETEQEAADRKMPVLATIAVEAGEALPPAPTCERRESFVLRDWLADVRSCLERDAARRGLGLELRCQRSLPAQLESDPAWLGGLLLALGREALDATAHEKVVVEVVEHPDAMLQIVIDGGGASLAPMPAMERVAERLGVGFERWAAGGLALVVPASA